MRQTLQMGSTQLELRQAEIDARSRLADETAARLAEEAEQLERERRLVSDRRDEVGRHLSDMREWYRKKIRELAGVDAPPGDEPGEGDVVPLPAPAPEGSVIDSNGDRSPARAVLTLNDEIDPVDRQLGEQLASLGLVDEDTLQALWAEARRQRRSLRQLLLAGGYLTFYQMSFIEADNLGGLVLGPLSIIDRLPSTPREFVFRVHDPRRNTEALLRHLAESEMQDAVRPDEFQQRFAAAASVQHGNIAGVLEVLDIAGRPAVLLEWINGLAAPDWPGLISAPGVWYRLVCQAAVALNAAHVAGLCHGHLEPGSFVLTEKGTLKLLGLGEPRWLAAATPGEEAESPVADLIALGRIAASWAATPATGKSKPKPLPAELQTIVARLSGEESQEPFASTGALLEELERASASVPASTTAWDRLLALVREQSVAAGMRRTA
jgi:hypothetical protein